MQGITKAPAYLAVFISLPYRDQSLEPILFMNSHKAPQQTLIVYIS